MGCSLHSCGSFNGYYSLLFHLVLNHVRVGKIEKMLPLDRLGGRLGGRPGGRLGVAATQAAAGYGWLRFIPI